jgi:hypothetical protein
MAFRGLLLVLSSSDRQFRRVIATLRWPEHLDDEARAFLRDNLLAERLGDSRRAEAALKKGFISASERVSFLAERPVYLPEPPHALNWAVDLEDLVAEFSTGIQALRAAAPELELRFEFTSEPGPEPGPHQ